VEGHLQNLATGSLLDRQLVGWVWPLNKPFHPRGSSEHD
jgi:hypothetical protein